MPTLEPTPPKSLIQLEHWFAALLCSPFRGEGEHRLPVYTDTLVASIKAVIAPSLTLKPQERIGLYHQQYWWRLFKMLHEQYPVLTRLFGYGDFNVFIAEPYFLKYPPSTWFVPYLGRSLPRWLDTCYHAEDRSVVLEIALVDEVHERLFHVPQVSSTIVSQKPLRLLPHVALLELEGDFFFFRQQMLEKSVEEWQDSDFPSIDWFSQKCPFVVYRTTQGIEHERLTIEQWRVLRAFERGAAREQALAGIDPALANLWMDTWSQREWFGTVLD